tara:strand:+ start:3022 stop:3387 length:366 start_codon:yes stop_codon:yes gene_type:complete
MGAGLRDIAPREVYSAVISKSWSSASDAYTVLDISALHPNESSKRIVVVAFFFTQSGSVGLSFKSNTTKVTGDMLTTANAWIKGNYNPDGHFKTAAGEDLNIVPAGSASTNIGGWINYYLE